MKELQFNIVRILKRVKGNDKEVINDYFRKAGMHIGKKVNICCNIMTPEPYLISIGNNVTIAGNVEFVTHDNSISKVLPNCTDLFGKITIGNNCFIGARTTILYGVTLADNIIVAAGSVVTNSFTKSNIIIGGNPAREISTWENFAKKDQKKVWNLNLEKKGIQIVNDNRLVKK